MLWRIFREFDLRTENKALLGQKFLLDLKVRGNGVNSVRVFKGKAKLIMAQLSEEDMPKDSTMKQWLFNNLEKHPIMVRSTET